MQYKQANKQKQHLNIGVFGVYLDRGKEVGGGGGRRAVQSFQRRQAVFRNIQKSVVKKRGGGRWMGSVLSNGVTGFRVKGCHSPSCRPRRGVSREMRPQIPATARPTTYGSRK